MVAEALHAADAGKAVQAGGGHAQPALAAAAGGCGQAAGVVAEAPHAADAGKAVQAGGGHAQPALAVGDESATESDGEAVGKAAATAGGATDAATAVGGTSVIDLTSMIREEDGREYVLVGGRRFYAGPPVDTRTKKGRAPPAITPLRVDEPSASTATPSQVKPNWVPDIEWAALHAKHAAEVQELMNRYGPRVPAGAASAEQVQAPHVVH